MEEEEEGKGEEEGGGGGGRRRRINDLHVCVFVTTNMLRERACMLLTIYWYGGW